MGTKKGTSYLEWVLLLGLMVALTAMALTWTTSFGKKELGSNIDFISGKMECESIKLSKESGDCSNLPPIKIKNRGSLNIDQLAIRKYSPTGEVALEVDEQGLIVNEEKPLNIANPLEKIEIIPVIISGSKLIGCQEKKITINC
ncbi:hypothetical protein HY643_00725 [Candidatus Woesearchaeota archaeon]|nr:hypothetical protein [Candidatus Woesearchaeota archaeon]